MSSPKSFHTFERYTCYMYRNYQLEMNRSYTVLGEAVRPVLRTAEVCCSNVNVYRAMTPLHTHTIQWSANNSTFSNLVNLLEKKYSTNVSLSTESFD